MRAPFLVVTAVLLAGCMGGAPPGGEGGEDGDDVEVTFRLSPKPIRGYWNETNLVVDGGEEVSWSFTASAPVVWDVHTHEGERVITLQNGTHADMHGSFTPPTAGVYSVYIENPLRDAPVDVTLTIQGRFQVSSA